MYKIVLHRKASKFLERLDAKNYQLVSDKIRQLSNFREVKNLDAKPLKGEFTGMFRLRVGQRRILFTVDEVNKEIKIWVIEDRGDAY